MHYYLTFSNQWSLAPIEVASLIGSMKNPTDAKLERIKRLALVNEIYEILFICNKENLTDNINSFDWNKELNKSYAVRTKGLEERKIAKCVYERISHPRINLSDPEIIIKFILENKRVYCTKLVFSNPKLELKRKPHHRPSLHPTSMDPRLAKAMVNLTGLTKGVILDPFCGSGGILIEAGLLGFDLIGCDLDQAQIDRALHNLTHYHLQATLHHCSALEYHKSVDAIVTDVPYGKGSKGDNLQQLYQAFLSHAKTLTQKMVIMFPQDAKPQDIIEKSPWNILFHHSIYVHKSMTRELYVLD